MSIFGSKRPVFCIMREMSVLQWNLDITNLYNFYLHPSNMEKNLNITKSCYSECVLPVPLPFVISVGVFTHKERVNSSSWYNLHTLLTTITYITYNQSQFITREQVSKRTTWSSQKLNVLLFRTASRQGTFYCRTVKLWNNLDNFVNAP